MHQTRIDQTTPNRPNGSQWTQSREITRHVELGRSPSSLISVASGAVKREQLDNLVHDRTALHEVTSNETLALELTLLACL